KQIEATKNLGKAYLESNAAHSHTYGYKLAGELGGSNNYWQQIQKLGIDVGATTKTIFSGMKLNTGDPYKLFELTPKQLEQIKTELPEAWAKIDDQTRGYLQTIIDSGDALSEMTDTLKESLTDLTFDSAKNSLKDLLLSTDTTLSDISDNFEKYMEDAIVNGIINNNLSTSLKKWYSDFAGAMKTDGLSEKEKNDLKKQYESIAQKGIDERNSFYAVAGIDVKNINNPALTGNSILRQITEETPGEFVGLMRRQADSMTGIRDYSRLAVDNLINIERNTFNTVTEVQNAVIELKIISKNAQQQWIKGI
ncbi:MAG: hypothetical protein WC389_21245, partial [Lutibacter sp.]